MGGDDWSFLDEECAKLEKKGGKKGGARGGRRGGQGDGGHRRATDDGLKNNDGKVDEGAGLDEWSALDDELARIERKGKGGGGDVTPAREDPRRERRDPSPTSASWKESSSRCRSRTAHSTSLRCSWPCTMCRISAVH